MVDSVFDCWNKESFGGIWRMIAWLVSSYNYTSRGRATSALRRYEVMTEHGGNRELACFTEISRLGPVTSRLG